MEGEYVSLSEYGWLVGWLEIGKEEIFSLLSIMAIISVAWVNVNNELILYL